MSSELEERERGRVEWALDWVESRLLLMKAVCLEGVKPRLQVYLENGERRQLPCTFKVVNRVERKNDWPSGYLKVKVRVEGFQDMKGRMKGVEIVDPLHRFTIRIFLDSLEDVQDMDEFTYTFSFDFPEREVEKREV